MKYLLTNSEQNQVKEIVVSAGTQLIHMKGAKILGSKNLGHHHGIDIVTQADLNTENFLRERLTQQFPHIGFYSEETAKLAQKELKKELVWVVDPIDGTLMFSRGLPFYGISLALMYQQKPVFGCIYLPEFSQLFWAMKNQGSFCGRNRLYVSTTTKLDNWYFMGGIVGLSIPQEEKLWSIFIRNRLLVRGVSCAVFHLAHTTAGHYDMSLHINNALWDIAAGWILIEEAGGKVMITNTGDSKHLQDDPYHIWFLGGNKHAVNWLVPKLKNL